MWVNRDNCRVVIMVRVVSCRPRAAVFCDWEYISCRKKADWSSHCAPLIWIFNATATSTDVKNIQKYLTEVQGFKESEMLILMDDGRHHPPTRKNIEDAFRRITEYSNAGDVVFVHYSGHGGRVRDTSGDEEDGYDETLIPVDFRSK